MVVGEGRHTCRGLVALCLQEDATQRSLPPCDKALRLVVQYLVSDIRDGDDRSYPGPGYDAFLVKKVPHHTDDQAQDRNREYREYDIRFDTC